MSGFMVNMGVLTTQKKIDTIKNIIKNVLVEGQSIAAEWEDDNDGAADAAFVETLRANGIIGDYFNAAYGGAALLDRNGDTNNYLIEADLSIGTRFSGDYGPYSDTNAIIWIQANTDINGVIFSAWERAFYEQANLRNYKYHLSALDRYLDVPHHRITNSMNDVQAQMLRDGKKLFVSRNSGFVYEGAEHYQNGLEDHTHKPLAGEVENAQNQALVLAASYGQRSWGSLIHPEVTSYTLDGTILTATVTPGGDNTGITVHEDLLFNPEYFFRFEDASGKIDITAFEQDGNDLVFTLNSAPLDSGQKLISGYGNLRLLDQSDPEIIRGNGSRQNPLRCNTVRPAHAFTPADLSASILNRWYDLTDVVAVSVSEGRIVQINDKSGNANHATDPSSDINRPYAYLYDEDYIGGALYTSDGLYSDIDSMPDQATMYLALSTNAQHSDGKLSLAGDGGTAMFPLAIDGSTNNEFMRGVGLQSNISISKKTILQAISNRQEMFNALNEQGMFLLKIENFDGTSLIKLGEAYNGYHFEGIIHEVLVLNGIPTGQQDYDISEYLLQKFML